MTTNQPGPGGSLDLDNLFTYHPPHGDQVARYAELRAAGRAFATVLAATVPSGPERSTALSRIREAVMWGNAGIACNERPTVPEPFTTTYERIAVTDDTTAESIRHDYPGGALSDLDPPTDIVLDEKAHPRGRSETP